MNVTFPSLPKDMGNSRCIKRGKNHHDKHNVTLLCTDKNLFLHFLSCRANINEVETEVVEIEVKLDKLVKLCSGMIEAGKAYVSANKLFVNGIRDLSQQCKKDEMISVRFSWIRECHIPQCLM
ncbi:unnamed protein product [Oncorhynchus mykiss]|uniref:BAR domain-containing protein n=1 Tax=Oncorhynchus mykiss TaxID=8022 RepID=A0A060XB86_ONCMY|nr:unnamed protein product [Oncorhynchus mykiss]